MIDPRASSPAVHIPPSLTVRLRAERQRIMDALTQRAREVADECDCPEDAPCALCRYVAQQARDQA